MRDCFVPRNADELEFAFHLAFRAAQLRGDFPVLVTKEAQYRNGAKVVGELGEQLLGRKIHVGGVRRGGEGIQAWRAIGPTQGIFVYDSAMAATRRSLTACLILGFAHGDHAEKSPQLIAVEPIPKLARLRSLEKAGEGILHGVIRPSTALGLTRERVASKAK